MKILNTYQIREADAYTIQHEPIASLALMERASQAFTEAFVQHYSAAYPVMLYCGTGNNGGDGLAVARMLAEKGYKVACHILQAKPKGSPDFEANLKKLRAKKIKTHEIKEEAGLPPIPVGAVVIDALFGTGLSRPLEGTGAALVKHINNSKARIVALDVPSGLFADKPNNPGDVIMQADMTLTFQLPKLAFMLCENAKYVGKWQALDIGLHPHYLADAQTRNYLIGKDTLAHWLIKRGPCDHKGSYGHALLWAGSYGKMGAAVLCSRAALHAGAGLVSSYVPRCGYNIMQISLPEAMCICGGGKAALRDIPAEPDTYRAIGAGPGIGTAPKTAKALHSLLKAVKSPMALDADALNIISRNREMLELIPPHSILTPHPKEFERLAGKATSDWERLDMARNFAREHNCVLVLKSGYTSVHLPDGDSWFYKGGTPGMATGGTGDVLTGIITGLLAQRYAPWQAAILGVYLHGEAGRRAAENSSDEAMLAGDVIKQLGSAFRTLKTENKDLTYGK